MPPNQVGLWAFFPGLLTRREVPGVYSRLPLELSQLQALLTVTVAAVVVTVALSTLLLEL